MHLVQYISEQLEHIFGYLYGWRHRRQTNLSIQIIIITKMDYEKPVRISQCEKARFSAIMNYILMYFIFEDALYYWGLVLGCFGIQIKQMLIRHISIHRQSIPISSKSHKDIQSGQQFRDYSDYLTRTLNPEQPDHDVLISEKTASWLQTKQKKESIKAMLGRSESMLQREIPQSLQNFTNFNLDYQSEIAEDKQVKQKRLRPNAGFHRKQNQKSRTNIIRHLHNEAYLQNKNHRRDYSLTPILKKTYSLNIGGDMEQYDSGIVNHHTKSSIVHGDLYRTLEKINAKNTINHFVDISKPLPHKKYSYSLPKTNFIPKSQSKVAQFTQTQRQDFIYSKPLSQNVQNQKNLKFLLKTGKVNSKKKNALPIEEQQNDKKQDVNLQPIIGNKRQQRKINLLESNITKRLEKDSNLSNNHIKIKPIIQPQFQTQKIEISYRTSLSELKQIIASKQLDKINVIMKIPEIFSYPLFTGVQDQAKLFAKSEQLLKHLQIKNKNDMSIKKYNNCILLIANYIAVVWHYTGKRYLGGWKYEMLDDGHKHGLGLEWSPKNYVYYGEFAKGKRQGVGIMKNSNNQLLAGIWHSNKFIGPLFPEENKQNESTKLLKAEKIIL